MNGLKNLILGSYEKTSGTRVYWQKRRNRRFSRFLGPVSNAPSSHCRAGYRSYSEYSAHDELVSQTRTLIILTEARSGYAFPITPTY